MKRDVLKLVLSFSTVALLATVLTFWTQPRPVLAQAPPSINYVFGGMGITRGFSAVLTVINASGALGLPPNPCVVEMAWTGDAAGRAAPDSVTVQPGGKFTMRVNGNNLIPESAPTGTRASVGAAVRVTSQTEVPPSPCVPSLEIVNNLVGITTAVGQARSF